MKITFRGGVFPTYSKEFDVRTRNAIHTNHARMVRMELLVGRPRGVRRLLST